MKELCRNPHGHMGCTQPKGHQGMHESSYYPNTSWDNHGNSLGYAAYYCGLACGSDRGPAQAAPWQDPKAPWDGPQLCAMRAGHPDHTHQSKEGWVWIDIRPPQIKLTLPESENTIRPRTRAERRGRRH